MSENKTQISENKINQKQIAKAKKPYKKTNNNIQLTSAGLIPNLIKKANPAQNIKSQKKLPAGVEKEVLGKNNKVLIVEEKPITPQKKTTRLPKKKNENQQRKTPVKIISLGGLHEIGKNLTAYECGKDIFLVDCGLSFPDDDMLGIDLVLPDFTYLEKNKDKIRGIAITHGHEDHIGGIPYLLKKINVSTPIYGCKLTLGILEGKLKEHNLLSSANLNVVSPGAVVKMGCMSVEFIEVNHSIPDACALAVFTPAGIIVQTGDFKIDYTPILGESINLARFGELGDRKSVV